MTKAYFISGLGADKRVFSFLDLSFCEPVFIDWIAPLKKESLKNYALRLRKLIPETDPVIIGISFGGMLVTEMAISDRNIRGIILSSNKRSSEFPKKLKIGRYMPVYKWLPGWFLRKIMLSSQGLLGAKGKEQKKILRQIILDTDISFTRWAIGSILAWKNKEIPENIISIHGTMDRLLPYSLIKADYTIERGSHVMPLDQPQEISDLLRKLI